MCYSAQIEASFKAYRQRFGARLSLREYAAQIPDPRLQLPRALAADFDDPQDDDEAAVRAAFDARRAALITETEQVLFAQRTRRVNAERALATKPTKSAAESARIASAKIDWASARLQDLRRSEPLPADSRIYPGWHGPVLVMEDGVPRVHLMRYRCRPPGKPADFDTRFPGTYNARRDNLKKFWRGQYGRSHGVVLAQAFYEHVQAADGRRQVLEFRPEGWQRAMLVACIWSRWSAPGEPDLLSFAALTDEPPPEVAAAGHDRCIIPLQEAHVEAWLTPQGRGDAALDALLDQRERPHYAHRLAA
jgi:putative SOS response-associated peptidase YedK